MLIMAARSFLVLLCLSLTSAGCFRTYHDLTNTPEIRDTRMIGKTYELVTDLNVIKTDGERFQKLTTLVRSERDAPIRTVPKGTLVTVNRLVEERVWPSFTFDHPLATLQGPAVSIDQVSLIDLLGGMSFGFGGHFSVVPDYTRLAPHLSHPVTGDSPAGPVNDLRDADFAVRYWAARKLGEQSAPPAPAAVDGLTAAATSDVDPEVRLRALLTLRRVSSDDPAIIRASIACLVRKPGYTAERLAARESLVKIGPPALPYLAQLLDGPDQDAIGEAAEIIGKAGPVAKPYLPRLAAVIPRFPAPPPRVTSAMDTLDPEGSVDLIAPMTRDRKTRKPAIIALEQFCELRRTPRPGADRIVAIMIDAVDDPDDEIRVMAVLGLERLDPPAEAALPRLREVRKALPAQSSWPSLSRVEVDRAIERIERR